MTIKGGGGGGGWSLMEKTILNFNFDYLHPSLILNNDQTFEILHNPIFEQKNFTHGKRITRDFIHSKWNSV